MLHECQGWMSPAEFLADYWQKKPLIMRGVFPALDQLLSVDELAGLSCLQGVESRLVWEKGPERAWQVEQGPFAEERLAKLPKKGWTLLVQRVDRLLAKVAELTENFPFIPNWRIDDIMVSYAVDAASVGPHTDLYDVFLLQGLGSRDWLVGTTPQIEPALIPDLDLKILAESISGSPVRLMTGDLLYIPPNFAHHGLAVGEAMTFSVGFRAPSFPEILTAYATSVAAQWEDVELYEDPHLQLQAEPGYLDETVIAAFQEKLSAALFAGDGFARWLAAEFSKPRQQEEAMPIDLPATPCDFRRREGARFLYRKTPAEIFLYIEGEEWQLGLSLEAAIAKLCRQQRFTVLELDKLCENPEFADFWQELLDAGYIFVTDSES
ncbi:MAG: cupin domain-containing protein [Oligoflexus sp.]